MASSNIKPTSSNDSKLFNYNQIELRDSNEAYLESCFNAIQHSQTRSMMDSNLLLQISETNKKNKEQISYALLYGILIDSNNSSKYFQDLLLLNGTNLSVVIAKLEKFIMTHWRRMYDHIRERSMWFLHRAISANIDNIDRLYYAFLRQISPQESSLDLCETLIELIHNQSNFLKMYPEMMLLTLYSFLSIVPVYIRQRSQIRHFDFILGLVRDNLHCIGRDAIRLLLQIGHMKEIDQFFKHLASTVSPDFLPKILTLRTEPKFIALPLSIDLEKQLLFLFENCRANSQENYYLDWFAKQHLDFKKNFDAIYLCSHIIRYACVVCRNHMMNNKITRWSFVLWILNHLTNYQQSIQQSVKTASQTAMNPAAVTSSLTPQLIKINEQIVQCRLALYFDWFLFDQNQLMILPTNELDFQLNSAVVGYYILKTSYHQSKQLLMFILFTSEHLIASLKVWIQQNLSRLFFELFQRIPILTSQQLLSAFNHERDIYQKLQSTILCVPLPNPTDDQSEIIPLPAENPELMIVDPTTTIESPKFSDDEGDDEDTHEHPSRLRTILQRSYDDDDMLMISDETKPSNQLYSVSTLRNEFPFERFRSIIHEKTKNLALSYFTCTNSKKPTLLTQIFKQIASTLPDKRPLIIVQPTDPARPIASFAMNKLERTSDKFQSRLLTMFDEATIIHGLLCLNLLRDSLFNRYLPLRNDGGSLSNFDESSREYSPQKLKRSIQNQPVFVLFRLIKDDRNQQDIYNRILQTMFFFQPELASNYLYYLSIEVSDNKIAAELFEKFTNEIIKLSSSHRQLPVPPAKMPTYDQDFSDFIHEILNQCELDDTESFLYLFSYVYRLYSKRLYNSNKLIRLLLHAVNQTELESFICDILKDRLQLFHGQKLASLIDQTLLYSQHEQEYFWQLLAAHHFVQNDYEQLFTNIIEHLLNQTKSAIGEQRLSESANFQKFSNTIGLANVLEILKTKQPTYGLVCCLFAHDLTSKFSAKLCQIWNEQHHDLFWRHSERILQKWLQRENDTSLQKVDYKIGTMKIAKESGLKYIFQHLQVLLESKSATDGESSMRIPLSKATIKSLVDFIHKDEQLYSDNNTFVDRFEHGISVNISSHNVSPTTNSAKRRKLDK